MARSDTASSGVVPSSLPGGVPVSHSENKAYQIANELEELPTKALEVMVWPEKTRDELAACAPMIRRRPMMARPCR